MKEDMNIHNRWPELVSNKTISLLCKWVERRICSNIKSPYIPNEVERWMVQKRYNKNDKAIYDFVLLSGIECARSTRPNEITDVDVFGFDVFLSLDEIDRLIILGYIDPFCELVENDCWKKFLKCCQIRSDVIYHKRLGEVMLKLQDRCEELDLAPVIKDRVEGWKNIARIIGVSVPTAMKLSRTYKFPISRLGKRIITTRSLMETAINNLFEKDPLWKNSIKREKGDEPVSRGKNSKNYS